MSDKYSNVSGNDLSQLDAEFYTALGWFSALSVSIASWACIA